MANRSHGIRHSIVSMVSHFYRFRQRGAWPEQGMVRGIPPMLLAVQYFCLRGSSQTIRPQEQASFLPSAQAIHIKHVITGYCILALPYKDLNVLQEYAPLPTMRCKILYEPEHPSPHRASSTTRCIHKIKIQRPPLNKTWHTVCYTKYTFFLLRSKILRFRGGTLDRLVVLRGCDNLSGLTPTGMSTGCNRNQSQYCSNTITLSTSQSFF
jgi:hypothetical protein